MLLISLTIFKKSWNLKIIEEKWRKIRVLQLLSLCATVRPWLFRWLSCSFCNNFKITKKKFVYLNFVLNICLQFLDHISTLNHRVLTEWQWPISGVHSIIMEKAALAGEGGGRTPIPFQLYLPSRTKLQCMLQLRGQIHSPYFIYMYSVLWTTCGSKGDENCSKTEKVRLYGK